MLQGQPKIVNGRLKIAIFYRQSSIIS